MIFYVNVAHVRNTAAELKPNVWEIYDSKTVISTLRFPAVLDYGKDCLRRIRKGIKINESYCYI